LYQQHQQRSPGDSESGVAIRIKIDIHRLSLFWSPDSVATWLTAEATLPATAR
jgi:hypothetical protein